MKKLLSVLFVVLLGVVLASAKNMGDDFHDHYTANSNLSAYNRDLTSMVGMVDFQSGSGSSFWAVNVGGNVNVLKPSSANDISSDSYIVLPFITAETRIPFLGLGVLARGTDANGYRSIGGGLTYQMDVIELLHLSFGAYYDNGRTDWYTHDHYSASAVASMSVLVFTPYIGVGYDIGHIKTRGFGDANRSDTDSTPRAMVGADITPFPFFSGFVAYTVTKDSHGFTGGLGFSF